MTEDKDLQTPGSSSLRVDTLMRSPMDFGRQNLHVSSTHLSKAGEKVVKTADSAEADEDFRLGIQVEYYGGDDCDIKQLISSQELTRNSAKLAQVRSMILSHYARTQVGPIQRALKRTTNVMKPANFAIFVDSAGSQSASSPASGGHTNYGAERLTERRKLSNFLDSNNSGSLHSQPKNAPGLAKTTKILDRGSE